MKKTALLVLTLAMVALFVKPVFAEQAHNHKKDAQAAQSKAAEPAENRNTPESMMQYSLRKMQSQMAEIYQTEDPQKRLTLLQEHNKSMRDSIKMMREMMGDMAMGCTTGGGHMMGSPLTSQPDSNADATPVARSNLDQIAATDKIPTNPAKKLWVCPMHPEVVQDHPGVCPKCGMDLVEMEQPGASQPEHSHMMGGCMSGDCMGGGMKRNHKMGGCMGGDMKCGCMKGGSMKGGCMKGGHKMGGSMKGGCMEGGMKCQMMGMKEKSMDMMLMLMLMLMEQMIEHNEAEMATPK